MHFMHVAFFQRWRCLLFVAERILGSLKKNIYLPNKYLYGQLIDKKKERRLQKTNLYDFFRKEIQTKFEAKIHTICI